MRIGTYLRILSFFLFLIFLCGTFNPPAFCLPSTDPAAEVYQTVSGEKSLATSPHFVVVDDFNTGQLNTQNGAVWRTKAPGMGALDLSLEKEDSRRPRGYSLNANFNLLAGETASLQGFLKRLDVSQAESLVFQVRLNLKEPRGSSAGVKLKVALEDFRRREKVREVVLPPSRLWKACEIPLSFFEGVDLNQLFLLRFTLVAGENKTTGFLGIDEIAFFGSKDVAFESRRDNLAGFPQKVCDSKRREKIRRKKKDGDLLKEIARDTWKYFQNARDQETRLIVDHLRVGVAPLAADYTSPTNIAMDLLSIIAASDLKFISQSKAENLVRAILSTLGKMKRYKKFFYNFYDTKNLSVTRNYISSVDIGWLAIALVVVRQAFKDLSKEATRFLDEFNFEEFLDPENNQLVVGLEVPEKDFGKYHYGIFATESRAASFYGIGKGDLPRIHWWFLYRTPPAAWKWQNQVPQGRQATQEGVDYFQGYYTYKTQKFMPSWGGSLFEFLMPTLVIKERELSPAGLGLNNRIATEIHRDYALKEKGYPVWGISPAGTSNGRQWRYAEYGIKALSVKGYPDRKIITPHVSFLALDSLPQDALQNIRKLLEFETYGEYGFFDSLDLNSNKANPQYLALDQGMILVAIANYLKRGSIRERFHKDPIAKNAEDLLIKEHFTEL